MGNQQNNIAPQRNDILIENNDGILVAWYMEVAPFLPANNEDIRTTMTAAIWEFLGLNMHEMV